MHQTRVTILLQKTKQLVELIQNHVKTNLVPGATVTAKADSGAKISVKLLSLLAIVSAVPTPGPQVRAELVKVAPAPDVREWVSNFITEDGQYILLANGKLLFVKEE
jgi:hypothetical protein